MSPPIPDDEPYKAEDALTIINALSISERKRLFKALHRRPRLHEETAYVVLPKQLIHDMMGTLVEGVQSAVEAVKLNIDSTLRWAHRNRTSAPETIRRNVELCDLRKQNPKYWSYARLAKKYDVTKRMISKILAEEKKWRGLAGASGTE